MFHSRRPSSRGWLWTRHRGQRGRVRFSIGANVIQGHNRRGVLETGVLLVNGSPRSSKTPLRVAAANCHPPVGNRLLHLCGASPRSVCGNAAAKMSTNRAGPWNLDTTIVGRMARTRGGSSQSPGIGVAHTPSSRSPHGCCQTNLAITDGSCHACTQIPRTNAVVWV